MSIPDNVDREDAEHEDNPPPTWHSTGTFEGPEGRAFPTGTLGACTYLLSESGEKITEGYHEFSNKLDGLNIDGKTYFLAKSGSCWDILEILPTGEIVNVSEQMERGDDGPGSFHEVHLCGQKLLVQLGSGSWWLRPDTRTLSHTPS